MAPLRIDVVSDIVCPWCYIGTRRLEQAIDSLGGAGSADAPVVAYHPFLLDPSIPILEKPFRLAEFIRLVDELLGVRRQES